MKILHIAAHMGGGIGSAYAGLGTCGQEQSILLLEEPIDPAPLDRVRNAGFRVLKNIGGAAIERELGAADAVVFSWHHHPALTKFMHDFPSIPIRSVLWCHVSGNYFPHISPEFVRKFDQTIFATPFSLELPQLQDADLQERCEIVYGLNDLSRFAQIKKKPHDQYTIGYVGTLGFCKLHPDFVDFCAAVRLPDVRFALAGQPSAKDALLSAAEKKGIAERFVFHGQLGDVTEALSQMDVFSYLLNPQHFGATENALLEAMAAGLPVIALNQCVERVIIRDRETGLLVRSPEEYGNAVRYLHRNPDIAASLGTRAREDVLKRFAVTDNRKRFLAVCRRAVAGEKRVQRFDDFFGREPADWFLSCVGEDRACFEENRAQDAGRIFRERTKGSARHYHEYFPEDERLVRWVRQLRFNPQKYERT